VAIYGIPLFPPSEKEQMENRVVARFDYDAAAEDEVSLRQGDTGEILQKVSEDWWLVQFNGDEGLVPSSYLSIVLARAQAEFDYEAQDDTEISFNENDTILVLEKLDADWWIGQANGQQGMFPSAYVKEVKVSAQKTKQQEPAPVVKETPVQQPPAESQPQAKAGNPNPLALAAQGVILKKTDKKEEKVQSSPTQNAPPPSYLKSSEPQTMASSSEKKNEKKSEDLEKQLEALKKQVDSKDKEIADLQGKLKESTAKLNGVENQKKEFEKRATSLEQEVERLRKELNSGKSNDESRLRDLREENARQSDQIRELERNLDSKTESLKQSNQDLVKTKNSLNDQIHDLQRKLEESNTNAKSRKRSSGGFDARSLSSASGELKISINGVAYHFSVSPSDATSPSLPPTAPPASVAAAPTLTSKQAEQKNPPAPPAPAAPAPTLSSKAAEQKKERTSKPFAPVTAVKKVSISVAPTDFGAQAAQALAKKPKSAVVPKAKIDSGDDASSKFSYAEKVRGASFDGKACEICTPQECSKFVPNQFKPNFCATCRHGKQQHRA
jgi:predicted  nucleic acid-binding Zn-ribbon protein